MKNLQMDLKRIAKILIKEDNMRLVQKHLKGNQTYSAKFKSSISLILKLYHIMKIKINKSLWQH